MRRLYFGLAAALVALVALTASAQSQGGSFLPTFNYVIGGQWTWLGASPLVFEGATTDSFQTTLAVTDPTAARTLTLPNATDTLVGRATTDTLTNKTVTASGAVTSSSASGGIGYATGAGCAVAQITNRTTGVTCAGVSGAITTDTTSLAAEAAAEFTVTDTSVAIGDTVVASIRSGSNGGDTDVIVSTVAAGSFKLKVANNNAAAGTAETGAIIINFAVIKAVSS
jgi:hypothetical protein